MKQRKYTVTIPVEIKVDDAKQLPYVVRQIAREGAWPSCDSYGEQCYSWRVRQDKARLKNAKEVRK